MPVSIEKAMVSEPCCTLDIEGMEQERLVQMFKALGNPVRFEILKYMLTHPGCITGDIVNLLPLAQSTVSQHLKVLRQAGWIHAEGRGTATAYCLDDENLTWFRTKVGTIF
jgi:DNA-binding transcriptional ArsR family regulator